MEAQQEFQLEEYRSLRREIDQHMVESRIEERYAVISTGITWGWLIVNHKTNGLLWVIPVFLTAAIASRTVAISQHIIEIGKYIKCLEKAFQVKGWEHHPKTRMVTRSNKFITCGLLILALIAWAFRKSLAS